MSQKEINQLTELAQEELKKDVSREEALDTFVQAGILDPNAKFTSPYEHLESYISESKK